MGEITEKKLKNQRFRRTEESILMAFFAVNDALNVDRIIKLAGISRSTLYRHHHTIYEVAPNYEQYLLRQYTRRIERLLKVKRLSLSGFYSQILRFIYQYRRIIEFLITYGHRDLADQMVTQLKPKILSSGKITNDEMFFIYTKEVAAIIEIWQRNGFIVAEIPTAVEKILHLTDSAHIRLSPITGIKSKSPHPSTSSHSTDSHRSAKH